MNVSSLVVALLLTFVLLTDAKAAAPRGSEIPNQDVKRVLAAEAEHDAATLNRRTELQPTLHPKTASDAEWWHAGFVKFGNAWVHAETAYKQVNSTLLNEYRALRDAAPKTAEGQVKLANWCQEHKLGDQERAHLLQVIVLSNSDAERAHTFRRMGYRKVGLNWVSPTELQEAQAKQKQDQERLREWQQTFERIVRNWSANPKQHKQALDELKTIDKPSAIPALLAASTTNETLALAICQQLDKMPTFEASQALATIAVHSDWPAVRQAATESLKGRRIDDFGPVLLGALRTHLSVTNQNNGFGFVARRLIFREEADRYVSIDLQFLPRPELAVIIPRILLPTNLLRMMATPEIARPLNRARIDNERFIGDADHVLQTRIDEENDRTEEYNERASATLAAVTGQEPSSNPHYWWAWWYLHSGTQRAPKQCVTELKTALLPAMVPVLYSSCLVAGTPIMTDTGFRGVEQIQVGDRVLSKNPETGELDFKPVIHTTGRDPVRVVRFNVGETTIVASEGHHFWVSGNGWTRVRDIKSGTPIHTTTGMSRAELIESEADRQLVYNLIVDDFHTYFVGKDLILSHDVSQPSPTNVKVPGLDAQ